MTAPSVWLTTLGCSKNQVDSDKITSVLGDSGKVDETDPESADVVMVNTCGFIDAARRESVDTILELADAKRDDARLVVIGCMAQRYESELIEALPEADAVIGLSRYSELVDELDSMTGWQPIEISGVKRSHMDILDVVRQIDDDEVRFELDSPTAAAIIKPQSPSEEEHSLFLIMPLRLVEQ